MAGRSFAYGFFGCGSVSGPGPGVGPNCAEVAGGPCRCCGWATSPEDGRNDNVAMAVRRTRMSVLCREGQERDAIVREQALDLGAMALEHAIATNAQRVVSAPPRHRDVEYEGKKRHVDLRRYGHDVERYRRAPSEVAGQRSPCDGDIDVPAYDRVDQARRRIGLRVITIDAVADYVANDVTLRERRHGRDIGVVVSDHMHADAEKVKPRVIERLHVEMPVLPIDKD